MFDSFQLLYKSIIFTWPFNSCGIRKAGLQREIPERSSSGVLYCLYLCRHQTERKNTHSGGNGGRDRGVEKWRVDCVSKTANLELWNWKNSSCQNTVLTEFRVLSVFAKCPSQKDVSKRERRDPLPYAQHSQCSGRTVESFRSGGMCMVSGTHCVLAPWSNTRQEVRSKGGRQIHQNVFISQTFQDFASCLYSSGRSSGKYYQAVLHMFWLFLFYVSSMKETATKFLSFLDQCFVKLWQLSMTESQVTFAADRKTESDLQCLVIFYIYFLYMTHSMCICVFHCSFQYN